MVHRFALIAHVNSVSCIGLISKQEKHSTYNYKSLHTIISKTFCISLMMKFFPIHPYYDVATTRILCIYLI